MLKSSSLGPDIITQIQSCAVVTKASALVGLGSKSLRKLDANHAVLDGCLTLIY